MKRTRWTMRVLGGLMLTAGAGGGCKQPLVMEPGDYHNAIVNAGAAGMVDADPGAPFPPGALPAGSQPATVADPDRPARPIALKECVAIALEQGTTGGSPLQPGGVSDLLPQFQGLGTTGTDAIRAFAVDPSIAAAQVERSLSKFDARLISSLTWNQVDNPVASAFQASFSNGDQANLTTTFAKPLPTGGVAGITMSTAYQKLANPPQGNIASLPTSYTPRVQFVLEQPLLQSFGVEINQLTAAHPGSFLIPGFRSTGQGTEGILITRLRQDQQRAQFDQFVNQMLLNVEAAYWNLYAAYFNLAAQEEGKKQALDAYLFVRQRRLGDLARQQQEFQTLAQYHTFNGQVIAARAQVLAQERQLRGLLGLRSDAGDRLVPTDDPLVAPFKADLRELMVEGRQYRPELQIIRQEVKARQLDLLGQRNGLRPDLRLLASYDIAGIGERIDGSEFETRADGSIRPRNALRNLASNEFNNWQLGVRFDVPIGFRDANGIVRQAQGRLIQSVVQMNDAERKMDEALVDRYRLAESSYLQVETNKNAKIASQRQIAADLKILEAGALGGGNGQDTVSFILALIDAQQRLANVTALEFQNLANYNIALARIEYEKGTIQRYNNVSVADGPLPAHVQKKAADHFAARDAAIKLREHPADNPFAGKVERLSLAVPPDALAQPVPPPPGSAGTAVPGQPAPLPQPPAPQPAPAPRPAPPDARPDARLVPQLTPADAAGTFTPAGTVVLPARPRGPAAPDSPLAAPPVAAPEPAPAPPLGGVPVSGTAPRE